MAANTLIHTLPGWSRGELLTPAQMNAVALQSAQSVNRTNTLGGTRLMPLIPLTQWRTIGGVASMLCEDATDGTLLIHPYASYITIPLRDLPNGHVLSSIQVSVLPAGSHSAQPATLPSLILARINAFGVMTVLGTTTYTWSSITLYEGGFTLAVPTPAAVDQHSYSYVALFRGEAGLHSKDDLVLQSLGATVTVDTSYGGPDLTLWL